MKERIEKLCKTAFQVDYRVRAYSDGKIRSLTEYFIYKEIMKEAVFLTFYEKRNGRYKNEFRKSRKLLTGKRILKNRKTNMGVK